MHPSVSHAAVSRMVVERASEISELLSAASDSDKAAIARLYELMYPKLREQSDEPVRGLNGVAVLDTTSLVHQSYLRQMKAGKIGAEIRGHFLAYAAHVMRSDVDYIRHATSHHP